MLKTFPGFDAARFTTHIREVRDEVFFIGRTRILAQTVKHSPNLHCLGFRVEYGGKALVYSGDAMYCTSLVELCRDATVAVLDCSFPANRPGPNHLHAGDCGRVAHEARVQQLVLSHFYPIAERYDVRAQAGRLFAGRILKGRDGLSLTL
jgi:ribonuclease BN (tRNA processing enzyme)